MIRARIELSAHAVRVVIEGEPGKRFSGHVGQTVLSLSHTHRAAVWHRRAVINGHWRVMPAYIAED